MELLEGTTLRDLIAGEPLPVRRLLDLGTQIADALEAAHARAILHRDIKRPMCLSARAIASKCWILVWRSSSASAPPPWQ